MTLFWIQHLNCYLNSFKLIFQGFCELDAAIFLDDENENATEDENDAKITSYFKEQVTAAISISNHRTEELKKQVTQNQGEN